MIKATELRIGNLVKCSRSNDAGIYKVLALDGWKIRIMLDGVSQNEWHPERVINPIPLTAEILEKNQFIVGTNDTFGLVWYTKNNVMIDMDDEGFSLSGQDMPRIKYVHQLQNLYYAIMQEELNIKL